MRKLTHSTRTYRIVLPGLPPYAMSPNARVHWSAKSKATRTAKALVWATIREVGHEVRPPAEPLAKAHVSIIWRCDGRRRDTDNMLARMKPYLDSLVIEGFIEDDSHKVIGRPDTEFQHSKIEQTEIIISEEA